MRRVICLVVLAMTASLTVTLAGARASDTGVQRPTFFAMACPDDVFPEDADVDCGYVRVPENRAHPHGRQITVAAAVVHAPSGHPAPDPIVFLDGGPSFPGISSFALDFYFAGAGYAANHDIVLVDTRGTGLSTPKLACPELDAADVGAFYAPPSIDAQGLPIFRQALRACRSRLVGAGAHPRSYNSAESAADLEALREALGVRRWNLFALSADGTLGLTYMRRFPSGVRSAVIDSGTSTQMLWGLDYDRGMQRELESIFSGCAANTACRNAYPGIRHRFYKLVRRLQRHPVTITFPDFLPHPVRLRLDGVGLYFDTQSSIFPGDLQFPDTIHDLLATLWRQTHAELARTYREFFGTGPVENAHLNNVLAQGKSMSYLCRDAVGFITRRDLHQAARDIPAFAARYLDPNFDLEDSLLLPISPAGCRVWDVGVAAPVQHKPVRSAIPTLVLAGEYDSGVPPYIVRQVDRRFRHSFYFEFPAGAHLQLASYNTASRCARSIASAFLTSPRDRPPSSCVGSIPGFDFTPPWRPRAEGPADSPPAGRRSAGPLINASRGSVDGPAIALRPAG